MSFSVREEDEEEEEAEAEAEEQGKGGAKRGWSRERRWDGMEMEVDRKSTRLNSSHSSESRMPSSA